MDNKYIGILTSGGDASGMNAAGEIIQEFALEILHPGADYAATPLTTLDVNRPGLPLPGFFEHFDPRRLVVIGLAETTFLERMDAGLRRERFDLSLIHISLGEKAVVRVSQGTISPLFTSKAFRVLHRGFLLPDAATGH